MDIAVQDINETRKMVVVSVSGDDIEQEYKKALVGFTKYVKVDGFRKGKVPANIIEKKYAKEMEEELVNKVRSHSYDKVVKESGLDIFAVVKLDEGKIVRGQGATLTFSLDVAPKVELPEYKGIVVELSEEVVGDDEIESAVNKVRDQRAEFKVVDEAAQKGDFVKIGYEGKIGDELIAEIVPGKSMYGTQATTWEEAGAEGDVPGIRAIIDGIVGMKAGDKKEVTMAFPEDFDVEELAGKEAIYSITGQEVRRKELPEMNEDFFKGIGVENLDDLKEKVKAEFLANKKKGSVSKSKDQVIKFLVANTSFPIPESAIEQEVEMMLRNYMTQLMHQGVAHEEFEKRKNELFEQANKRAPEHAKTNIILEEIGKRENIQLKNEDLNLYLMQEAMMARMKPQELVKELQKDRKRVEEIKRVALVNKVLDFLCKEANIKYVEAGK